MVDRSRQFGTWDWVLFAAMLVVSGGIGIYYGFAGRRQRTTTEFLMGGRNMQVFPVAISILVSFASAIMILGTPAEMYTAGTLYFLYMFGLLIALVLSAQMFVPLLYPLKLTSSFEYLERRFQSKAAKLTGTFIMIIQQVLYMGIASYAPSTALDAVTGFPVWATILTIGCVSTFYTFLGGMKAVVWTDTFQSSIMTAGLLAIVIQGAIKVGGLDVVWDINDDWRRIDFWEADPDPTVRHSVWSLIVGGTVGWLGTYGVNQASVQRYCALPTLQKAKGAVLTIMVGVFVFITLSCLCGIVMFAYYAQKGCDPLTNKDVSNSNQLIPYFVMEVLGYPGLPGLFISCLFSGALRRSIDSQAFNVSLGVLHNNQTVWMRTVCHGTMSSCLNALSAVTWEDILKPVIGQKVSESVKTWITKFLVIIYGAAGVGFAFMAQNLGGTVLQAALSFNGAATGPLLGIFLLGALFPWANWLGCLFGGLIGLALPLWISIGAYSLPKSASKLEYPTYNCSTFEFNQTMTILTTTSAASTESTGVEALYTVSYLWYPSIGAATAVVVGLLVSLVTGPTHMDEVDPKYLIPLFDRIFCCLPESLRRKLRCNLHFQDPRAIVLAEETAIQEKDRTFNGIHKHKHGNTDIQHTNKNGITSISYGPMNSNLTVPV